MRLERQRIVWRDAHALSWVHKAICIRCDVGPILGRCHAYAEPACAAFDLRGAPTVFHATKKLTGHWASLRGAENLRIRAPNGTEERILVRRASSRTGTVQDWLRMR